MHRTRTPLRTWFWAACLVATPHPGISAKQLQRELGLSRYETAWLMLHKLRRAMIAPERSLLTTEVEVDEFFLGGLEEGLKGGRQRGKKALVGVAIEVRGRGSGRLRFQVLPDIVAGRDGAARQRAVVVAERAQAVVAAPAVGMHDRAGGRRRGHERAQGVGAGVLPRAHRAISNLKAWMHGTHRGVSDQHLAVYLNEFVFRHNRRGTPMAAFQTLLGLGTARRPTTYRQMTESENAA